MLGKLISTAPLVAASLFLPAADARAATCYVHWVQAPASTSIPGTPRRESVLVRNPSGAACACRASSWEQRW